MEQNDMNNNMMMQNEIQIPEIAEKQKQKKTWIVAAGILAACFIVVAMILVVIVKIYNTDERKLLAGFKNLAEEAGEWNEIWQKETGNDLSHYMDNGKVTGSFNLSAEEIPVTIGIDIESMRDIDAKRVQASMILSVTNVDLAEISLYGDEKQMIIFTPDFWKQNLAFQTSHIEKQYNNSMWADKFGKIDEEEITLDLFEEAEEQGLQIDFSKLLEEWKEFKKSGLTIEKLDKTVEIDVQNRNNTVYQCSQYRITIPQELVGSIVELSGTTANEPITTELNGNVYTAQQEIVIEEIASDVVLLVAMNKNNQIVQIQFEEPVLLSTGADEKIEFSGYIMFLGTERSIDDTLARFKWNIPMAACIDDEETKKTLDEYGIDEEFLPDVNIVTDMNITFDGNDVCVGMNLDELTMSVEGLGTYKVTGNVEVEPLEETIKPLEGETIDLFKMTEEEYEDLESQLLDNLNKWSSALDSIY